VGCDLEYSPSIPMLLFEIQARGQRAPEPSGEVEWRGRVVMRLSECDRGRWRRKDQGERRNEDE
jgi:hypothetical protein